MSEHTWFQENLAAYTADGLTIDERERFERHRVACAPCAKLLGQMQGFDATMAELFTEILPDSGWENQVIENLRAAPPWHRVVWSKWVRIAAGVAALVFLGILGAAMYRFLVDGNLFFPGVSEPTAAIYIAQSDGVPDGGTVFLGGRRLEQLDDSLHRLPRASGGGSQPLNEKRGDNLAKSLSDELTDTVKQMDDTLSLARSHGMVTWGRTAKGKTELSLKNADKDGSTEGFALTANGLAAQSDRKRNSDPFLTTDIDSAAQAFDTDINLAIKADNRRDTAAKKTEYWRIETKLGKDAVAGAADPRTVAGSFEGRTGFGVNKQAGVAKSDLGRTGGKEAKAEQPVEKQLAAGAPEPVSRKIIRTGDIEFEVEGFDAAVAGITRLVGGIKNGFVATINSDKLPNGKVKGSVVVRVPPEALDKFLLDLRQELAKSGELKSQRIGSQDITKQYTDIESRLRGARVMEERFLQIIKTGKGDIKDLVAAENALGMWRTKIEEMEGEIRYYNNQVGLSTLTITLVEKEIQAPAAIVVTERLKMQIEVEDVEKAQRAALAAVAEAKGRVTKADLKQHAAGQLEAILHFEVAPNDADKVRDRLKQLGHLTSQDSDRSQQTQGAGSAALDIKIKQNDVKFEVGLYNVANIQPRETLVLQLASLDVAGSFRKVRDAVAKAQGQLRIAQLNEQDLQNISGQLDFDVPTAGKQAIDTALADVGTTIGRTANQAAVGETATDRKTGYRVTFRNAAGLAPRESIALGMEVKDVDQASAAIADLVKAHKGRLGAGQVNQERSGRVAALLRFDVPLTAKDEVLRQLKATGTPLLQTSTRNPQAPDGELAVAHVDLTLTTSGPIVPSDEALWPKVRTSLFYSFTLLSWSLMLVIMGLLFILPWVVVLWAGYKVVRRLRRS